MAILNSNFWVLSYSTDVEILSAVALQVRTGVLRIPVPHHTNDMAHDLLLGGVLHAGAGRLREAC